MQILHLIASLNPAMGGLAEGVMRLGPPLANRGHEQSIVCLDRPDDPWILTASMNVYALGKHNLGSSQSSWIPWQHYGYTPDLIPWLKANVGRYDVVIVHGLWNYCALAARIAFAGTPVRYFVFTHGMLDPWFRKTYPLKTVLKQFFWWFNEGPLLHGARSVLFTTEEERILARNAFRPYRLSETVVGFGTADVAGNSQEQITAFRAKLPGLGDHRFLLFLSRIHEKKGCDLLIEAFAKVTESDPALHLVIAGPDHVDLTPSLKKIADRRGIANKVHWPGMLSGDAKWGAFRSCEAFVLPSHQENFGIVVAEAMACARPVLMTDKVNTWREVKQGGGGLVAGDDLLGIEGLLAAFLSLSTEEQKQMGNAARATFLKHFNIDANVTTLLNVLSDGNAV
jgi:glycosyltransferase involved in cell wall biosynthesis